VSRPASRRLQYWTGGLRFYRDHRRYPKRKKRKAGRASERSKRSKGSKGSKGTARRLFDSFDLFDPFDLFASARHALAGAPALRVRSDCSSAKIRRGIWFRRFYGIL